MPVLVRYCRVNRYGSVNLRLNRFVNAARNAEPHKKQGHGPDFKDVFHFSIRVLLKKCAGCLTTRHPALIMNFPGQM
jgi:hypothetical protein